MARNVYEGVCYRCGLPVKPMTGHFQRHDGKWRTHHANHPGHGRITCAEAARKPTTPAKPDGEQ